MPPTRLPLMETSDNTATSSPAPPSTAARRSGRVTKAPAKFTQDAPPQISKRKRAADNEDDDDDNDGGDDDDAENELPDDGAIPTDDETDGTIVDENHPRPKKKKASSRPKKPATKKPKINGSAPAPASSTPAPTTHTARLPSRPKKTVRIEIARRDGDDLYAEIFASGKTSKDVATEWYHKYQADDTTAVTDLVNCVLLAAGCDQQVTVDDIQDPENCQNRLADLQNVYTEEGITEYPLISRARSTRSFRDLLTGFFRYLVDVLHETDVLYTDTALMDNIARWVASMSSSTLRPFRHTATTVALAMEAALVEVAKKLDDRITKMTQQVDAEKRRKGKNKEMLAAIQQNLEEANQHRTICGEQIKDFFDTVFVHRYRDIDSKIRTECVEALGTWIWLLPTVFMEPEYLRYLGWMLSDVIPQTRHEVLKQLTRIFKRDAEKLGHFIDRFRSRLVEMATKDSDVSVRVAAISVIHILKDTGMLEPDEMDAIGRLVFDSELRVRRAVVDFFVDCVNDYAENKIEEMGGADTIDELFGSDDGDDYSIPRRDWIGIKCLAELLAVYDAQLEEENAIEPPRGLDIAVEMIQAAAPETRISLAAQVLYEKIDQLKNWELLAGYVLYDHTTSTKSSSKSKQSSTEAIVKKAVAPDGKEEAILLEVLAAAVKSSLVPHHTSEADRNRRKGRTEHGVDTGPENAAVHLATVIPRLLNKFGADASTAVIVLRLEHYLDLDVFQQLRQDSSTYQRLLDGICTQFDRHVDRGVVSEATAALLHARRYEELQELADSKISDLWGNVINSLRHFDNTTELGIRGNLDAEALAELGHVLLKVSKLASVSNCIDVLEADGAGAQGDDEGDSSIIEALSRTVGRGKLEQVDEELDDLEDEAVSYAIKACQFYFMWKVRHLMNILQQAATSGRSEISLNTREVSRLNSLRTSFESALIATLSSRGTNDDLRLFATGALCDLHVVFANARQQVAELQKQQEQASIGGDASGSKTGDKYAQLLEPLFVAINPGLTGELIEIYNAAERAYARSINKVLNEPAADEAPVGDAGEFSDEEEEVDDEEDSEEAKNRTPAEKKARELKAERALCELAGKLVLAMLTKMVDQEGPSKGKLKRRMLRNQNKLGPNLRETLSYLTDETKVATPGGGAVRGGKKRPAAAQKGKTVASKGPAANSNKKAPLSEEIVVAEDDESELELELDDDEVEDPFADEADKRKQQEKEPEEIHEDDEPEVEEGSAEDLRRRELLDDPIEDEEDDEDENMGEGGGDEDSVIGD